MDRRSFLVSLGAVLSAVLALGHETTAGPVRRAHRRHRRRVRRRIRRRHRRRVIFRAVNGRRAWVVPVGLAIGWELVHHDRVVVVKEIEIVETDGVKSEVAVVQNAEGDDEELERVAIVRQDTKGNQLELEGSRLPDDDTTTPGVEAEIEEEVEDEEGT